VTEIKGLKQDLTEKERSRFLKQLKGKGLKGVLRKNIEDGVPLRGGGGYYNIHVSPNL
jgi:hypothetical protein